MKLIVGLGNPGRAYDDTRHNVGFMVLDCLGRRYAPGAVARSKFQAAVLETTINDEKLVLLKPVTYMNRSGQSVADVVRFFKLDPATDLLVLVDDIALSCGLIRLREGGGSGGHQGLADIERALATSDYARLRLGIDAPGQVPQRDYVLGRFRPDQLARLEPGLEEAVDAAACWAIHGAIEAMNRFNRRNTA